MTFHLEPVKKKIMLPHYDEMELVIINQRDLVNELDDACVFHRQCPKVFMTEPNCDCRNFKAGFNANGRQANGQNSFMKPFRFTRASAHPVICKLCRIVLR